MSAQSKRVRIDLERELWSLRVRQTKLEETAALLDAGVSESQAPSYREPLKAMSQRLGAAIQDIERELRADA